MEENINIIFQMNIYCGFYALIIHFITGIPLYIDEEKVEFIRLRRMGNPYWRLLKIFGKIGCHFSKGMFCVSELDKNLISAYFKVNKGKIRVIQNGFEFDKNKYKDLQDQSIRSCNGLESNEKAVLFFGNLYYQPNAEALKIIYNEIVPRIDGKIAYKIWIIGKGAPPDNIQKNRHPRVMLLGEKPDVYPYILASDLIIVPLVSGGGTRIKIIESIAAGKRVLSTSLGAEGIERDGLERNLIVEDDWNEFAKRIIYLLENCHDTLTVTQDFIDRFRWKNIVEKIEF